MHCGYSVYCSNMIHIVFNYCAAKTLKGQVISKLEVNNC